MTQLTQYVPYNGHPKIGNPKPITTAENTLDKTFLILPAGYIIMKVHFRTK
jgi:hypothetical protein